MTTACLVLVLHLGTALGSTTSQTVWSSGPYSAPNGDAGSVVLPPAFCVTISDLVLQSWSSCGTHSPQSGQSARTIAVLGTEANDCNAGFKIYYSRNCRGINMGVSEQGHWWKTATTLDLPAGVSYNVKACYSSASTELVVTGPSGIVATEQSSCYPCSSFTFQSSGSACIFRSRVGHIYPWDLDGASLGSVDVTAWVPSPSPPPPSPPSPPPSPPSMPPAPIESRFLLTDTLCESHHALSSQGGASGFDESSCLQAA